MTASIPASHQDLLERALFGHLATIRPDGSPQANPMWFVWDGEFLLFTNTTRRKKYQNVTADPRVAMSVHDPDHPYRYLEVRGVVERIEPDPEGDFYVELGRRYGYEGGRPGDASYRVKYFVRPTATSLQ